MPKRWRARHSRLGGRRATGGGPGRLGVPNERSASSGMAAGSGATRRPRRLARSLPGDLKMRARDPAALANELLADEKLLVRQTPQVLAALAFGLVIMEGDPVPLLIAS